MKLMKLIIYICSFLICSSFYSCSESPSDQAGLILNIPSLVNKLPNEVAEILGEPDTVYYDQVLNKKFFVQRYKRHDIEIQYLKGRANDIIVNQPWPVDFEAGSLRYFGIKPAQPTVYHENEMIKWKNHSGLKTINFYKVRKDSTGNIISYKIFFKA